MGRKDKQVTTQNTDMLHIGARLRIARQTKGIRLTAMADEVGYSVSYLSGVENGYYLPSQELLQRYKRTLGIESSLIGSNSESKHKLRRL